MPRLSHDKPGLTYACPACDKTSIYQRTGNGYAADHPDRPFKCEECSVALHYVIERPKKGTKFEQQSTLPGQGQRRSLTSREISAMEPEDFGLSPIGVRGGAD